MAIASFNVRDWYWVVGDHNPTTEVYSTASNAYVANNAAAYLTWLTNGEAAGYYGGRMDITAMADNGSGKVRLTVLTSINMQTGQRWNFSDLDGSPLANGNQQITVVDGTHIDITAVSFVASTLGVRPEAIGATIISTDVELRGVINNFAASIYKPSSVSISTSSNVVLTNPLPTVIEVTPGANINLTLPDASTVDSIPLGVPFYIRVVGGGANTVTVKDAAAATLTILDDLSSANAVINKSNATAAGSYSMHRLSKLAVSASATDIGTGTLAAARLPQFTGGDVTTAGVGSTNLQIGSDVVGNAELANMAQGTVKGRARGAGTGDPTDLTGEQQTLAANDGKPAFSAHKNGTDQTGITSGANTKITFGTEAYDIGSYYDAANSKWTPPAGRVALSATLYVTANVVDGNLYLGMIFKNGGLYKIRYEVSANAVTQGVSVYCEDDANGTDSYEVYFNGAGAGNKTISGQTFDSYFQGHVL